jgi:dGTPase
MRASWSRGRRHPEQEHPYRSLYQRDRDRIVHSAAFRRLMYKTQVLVNEYSDYHRTRLTHTLEVAQISRTLARELGLNEDLTEAVALAHDLGHPPFGHAGETALDQCMRQHGGYEHNRHGLRLVEKLERRYPGFHGLNLTWELLESLAYHSKNRQAPEVKQYLSYPQPYLEAQIVDAADSLAYDTHDLDDALSLGLVSLKDLQEVDMLRQATERAQHRYGPMTDQELQYALVRILIDWQVNDLLETTRRNLEKHRVRSVEDIRSLPEPLAQPSEELAELKQRLEAFLTEKVYRHFRVQRMANKAQRFITALFHEYCRAPGQLPEPYQSQIPTEGLEQTVCDYLAGMTDRFAQDEYLRLFHPFETV